MTRSCKLTEVYLQLSQKIHRDRERSQGTKHNWGRTRKENEEADHPLCQDTWQGSGPIFPSLVHFSGSENNCHGSSNDEPSTGDL